MEKTKPADMDLHLKAEHLAAVFASLILAALLNALAFFATGAYLPEALGAFSAAYAALLLAAFTLVLSGLMFGFSRKDAPGLGIANAAILLAMAVAWKFVAENLGYPLGPELARGIPFALLSALLYFGVLYLALPNAQGKTGKNG